MLKNKKYDILLVDEGVRMKNNYSSEAFAKAVAELQMSQNISDEEMETICQRVNETRKRLTDGEINDTIKRLTLQSYQNSNRTPRSRYMIYFILKDESYYRAITNGNFEFLRRAIKETELGALGENVIKSTRQSLKEFFENFAKLDSKLQQEIREEIIKYFETNKEVLEKEYQEELQSMEKEKSPRNVQMPNIANNANLPGDPIDIVKNNREEFIRISRELNSLGFNYITLIQQMIDNHVLPNSPEGKKMMEEYHITNQEIIIRYFELLDIVTNSLSMAENQEKMRQLISRMNSTELELILSLEEEKNITLETVLEKIMKNSKYYLINRKKILQFFSIKDPGEMETLFEFLNSREQDLVLAILERMKSGKEITREELEMLFEDKTISLSSIIEYFLARQELYNDVDDMLINHFKEIRESNKGKVLERTSSSGMTGGSKKPDKPVASSGTDGVDATVSPRKVDEPIISDGTDSVKDTFDSESEVCDELCKELRTLNPHANITSFFYQEDKSSLPILTISSDESELILPAGFRYDDGFITNGRVKFKLMIDKVLIATKICEAICSETKKANPNVLDTIIFAHDYPMESGEYVIYSTVKGSRLVLPEGVEYSEEKGIIIRKHPEIKINFVLLDKRYSVIAQQICIEIKKLNPHANIEYEFNGGNCIIHSDVEASSLLLPHNVNFDKGCIVWTYLSFKVEVRNKDAALDQHPRHDGTYPRVNDGRYPRPRSEIELRRTWDERSGDVIFRIKLINPHANIDYEFNGSEYIIHSNVEIGDLKLPDGFEYNSEKGILFEGDLAIPIKVVVRKKDDREEKHDSDSLYPHTTFTTICETIKAKNPHANITYEFYRGEYIIESDILADELVLPDEVKRSGDSVTYKDIKIKVITRAKAADPDTIEDSDLPIITDEDLELLLKEEKRLVRNNETHKERFFERVRKFFGRQRRRVMHGGRLRSDIDDIETVIRRG